MTPDDVEARFTALEQRIAQLHAQQVAIAADAAAARVLAAGADGDVEQVRIELRAQRQLLNALRETQRDHSLRLDSIEGRLDSVDARLGSIESHLVALDQRTAAGFATMQAGMQQIVRLLTDQQG